MEKLNKINLSIIGFIIIVGIGLGYVFLILPGQIEKDMLSKIPDSIKLDYEKFSLDYLKPGVVLTNVNIKINEFDGVINANEISVQDLDNGNISFLIKFIEVNSESLDINYESKQLSADLVNIPGIKLIADEFKKDQLSGLLSFNNANIKMLRVKDSKLKIKDIQLNFNVFSIDEIGNGLIKDFYLDSISFVNIERNGAELKIGELSINSLPIPDQKITKIDDLFTLLSRNELGSVKIMDFDLKLKRGNESKFCCSVSKILLNKPEIKTSKLGSPYISDIKLDIQKVVFPLEDIPRDVRKILSQLIEGNSISVNHSIQLKSDHVEKIFSIELSLGEENLSDIGLGVSFLDVPDDYFDLYGVMSSSGGMEILQKFQNTKLTKGNISYEENGLLNKYLTFLAQQERTTVEELKKYSISILEVESGKSNSETFKNNVNQLITFIKQPVSLKIEINPENPLEISKIIPLALRDRDRLNKLIDLNVKANEIK
jgi:hypothetical protein